MPAPSREDAPAVGRRTDKGRPNRVRLEVQLYLSCPSANFNNQYIGHAESTGSSTPAGNTSTNYMSVTTKIVLAR